MRGEVVNYACTLDALFLSFCQGNRKPNIVTDPCLCSPRKEHYEQKKSKEGREEGSRNKGIPRAFESYSNFSNGHTGKLKYK